MARWKLDESRGTGRIHHLTVIGTALVAAGALIVALQTGSGAAPTDTPSVSDPTVGPAPSAGTGRDPLTPAELTEARRLGDGPAEFLYAELGDGPGRRAALYYYDYGTDELVKQVVDLTAGRLAGSYRATEMQPPPTDHEVATAFTLLLASPLGDVFRTRWAGDIGTAFTDPAAATVTAQTFVADGSTCGRHRCVQLLPRAGATGDFVDVSDIVVDLSGRAVWSLR